MAEETKSTVLIATISAISVALITTYGAIIASAKDAKQVRQDLKEISVLREKTDLQNVKKNLQEITNLNPTANLPIGTILPSMLHPGQFADKVGDPSPSLFDPNTNKWAPVDGREVFGSKYSKELTLTLPDLRGMFIRGLNYFENRDLRTDNVDHIRRGALLQLNVLKNNMIS